MALTKHSKFGWIGTEFFDSTEAAAKAAAERGKGRESGTKAWYGATFEECLDRIVNGWKDGIQYLKSYDDSLLNPVQTNGNRWGNDVAGAYPLVPAFIAGDPMNMRRRKPSLTAKGAVRVFVSVAYSASFSNKEVAIRGAVIAELVTKLSITRPVELYVFAEMTGSAENDHKQNADNWQTSVIRIGMSPINIGVIAQALVNVSTLRRLMFAIGRYEGNIGWAGNDAYQFEDKQHDSYQAVWRDRLGAGPDDLILGGCTSANSSGAKMIADPKGWLNTQLVRYGLKTSEAI